MESVEQLSWYSKLGINPIFLLIFLIELAVLGLMLKVKNKLFFTATILIVSVLGGLGQRYLSLAIGELEPSNVVIVLIQYFYPYILIPSFLVLKAFVYYTIFKEYRFITILKAVLLSAIITYAVGLLIVLSGFGPYMGLPIK